MDLPIVCILVFVYSGGWCQDVQFCHSDSILSAVGINIESNVVAVILHYLLLILASLYMFYCWFY